MNNKKEEWKPKCLYCFVDAKTLKECGMNLKNCKQHLYKKKEKK